MQLRAIINRQTEEGQESDQQKGAILSVCFCATFLPRMLINCAEESVGWPDRWGCKGLGWMRQKAIIDQQIEEQVINKEQRGGGLFYQYDCAKNVIFLPRMFTNCAEGRVGNSQRVLSCFFNKSADVFLLVWLSYIRNYLTAEPLVVHVCANCFELYCILVFFLSVCSAS